MSKKIFFLFLIILINSLFIPQPAFAFWDWIVGVITYLPSLFVIILLQLIIIASGLLASIGSALLRWVVSPGFTTISYTNPAENPFINVGLSITQGFVNMGLVLALVVIAFATILRLPGYDTIRLLIKFIIVTLLVNFAPNICGLIVDAFNIVMHYFTQRLDGLTILTNIFVNIGNTLWHAIRAIRLTDQVTEIVQSIIFIIYNLLLTFILLIFAFLFAVRYVAIWLSVILAPIAFVCWILPATKRWWDWWWNQFIEWSMIGVVGGFFLYLSARLAELIAGTDTQRSIIGGGWAEISGFLPHPGIANRVLPQLLTLACLYISLTLGLKTSALGAAGVIGAARKTPGWLGKRRPVQRVLGWGAGKISTGLEQAEKTVRRLEERAGKTVLGKALIPSLKVTQQALKAPVGRLLRYKVRTAKPTFPPEFDKMTPEEQARYIESSVYFAKDRLYFAERMAELETLQKAPKEFREKIMKEAKTFAKSPDPNLKKAIGKIRDSLPDKITAKLMVDLETTPEAKDKMKRKIKDMEEEIRAEARINTTFENAIIASGKDIEDIAAEAVHVREMSPGDITRVAKSSLDSLGFRWGMHYARPDKLSRAISTFGQEEAEKILEGPGGWNQLFRARKGKEKEQIELLAKFQRENEPLFGWLFLNPTGRHTKFAGRQFLKAQFKNYENFRRLTSESNELIEDFDSFNKLYDQLVKVQTRVDNAQNAGQSGEALLFESTFAAIQEKASEMVKEIKSKQEIRNIQNVVNGFLPLAEAEHKNKVKEALNNILSEIVRRINEL